MDEVTSDHHGWPTGQVGFFKGLGMGPDGRDYYRRLSLSNGVLAPSLLWYKESADPFGGFVGEPLSGNRIALYARNQEDRIVGLRGHVIREELRIYGQRSAFPIGLVCSLVPIPIIGHDPFF
ncbi:hypothetical protein PHLCEN_2v1894 [Hermanssonia centrifuga]|uniref:Uncharacterized protein n=1 Tax=Hermanssonia centrifuga TaxID=98765 RepID=A0A2R6RVK7_9APHY|nr:hypothetical protein PHLCEN_2v1894 [Hermanssonia centrifuga]